VTDNDDATVDVAPMSPTVNEELVLPVPADPLGDARAELAAQLVEQARAEG
jgi:hypothetical protein